MLAARSLLHPGITSLSKAQVFIMELLHGLEWMHAMNRFPLSFFVIVPFAFLQPGCSKDAASKSEVLVGKEKETGHAVGIDEEKQGFEKQEVPSKLPASLSSWKDYLATLTQDHQTFLSRMAMKYRGSLEYGSPVERARLARLGYPMPEALVAENKLTNDELLARAKAGNMASKAVYAERIAQRIEVLERVTGEKGLRSVMQLDPAQQRQLTSDANTAFAIAAGALKFTPTPFTAYLYGRMSAVTAGTDIPAISSIAVARDLGDERAATRLSIGDGDSQVSGTALLNDYESMRKMAGIR